MVAKSKIGVSVDQSSYSHGFIFDSINQTYFKYTGRWSNAPVVSYKALGNTTIAGKVSQEIVNEDVFVRLRYMPTGSDNAVNIDVTSPVSTSTYEDSSLDEFDDKGDVESSDDENTDESSLADPTPTTTPLVEESTDTVLVSNTDSLSSDEKSNIVITEFFPYPGKGKNEWVEIYNDNTKPVTLSDWFIDDAVELGGRPIKFSATIKPKSYSVIEINKSLLNNSGDVVSLLDGSKHSIHTITYKKALKDHSIQKISNKWLITRELTKGTKNISNTGEADNLKTILDTSSDTLFANNLTKVAKSEAGINYTKASQESQGEVLGDTCILSPSIMPSYKKYPMRVVNEDSFTAELSGGNLYVYTSKNESSPWLDLMYYFNKAFW